MTKYLNRKDLIENFPVPTSRPGLLCWVREYGFPAPVYANANTPIWKAEEVEDWFVNLKPDHIGHGR
jgi:hypothetical protein